MGVLLLLSLGASIFFGSAQLQTSTNSSVPVLTTIPGQNDLSIILTEPMDEVYIDSPRFPDEDYPPNSQTYYTVQVSLKDKAAELGARIIINFVFFALQKSPFCTDDGLEITEPSNQLRVFCGSQSGRTVLSETSSFQMRLFTNGEDQNRGFRLSVKIFSSSCSETFEGLNSGSFNSPGFPNSYISNELCIWKIVAPPNKKIEVRFNENFAISGYQPQCVNDKVTVSTSGDFSIDMTSYCGRQAPGSVVSDGNVMLVKFSSDCCFQDKGFGASFRVVDEVTTPSPPEPVPTNCECGKENLIEERIVDGEDVSPENKFPWMAGLFKKNDVFCGATIINNRYVLTAAHCLSNESPNTTQVLCGSNDLQNIQESPVAVENFIIHPRFNKVNFNNDIALVKLQAPLKFSNNVGPVCLPPTGFDQDNREGVILGWGRISEGGDDSKTLKEATMTTITLGDCKQKYGSPISDTNLCAGGNGKDACQGDSGGPYTTKEDGKRVLIGIISWGIGCGRDGYPGVFTLVSAYISWIVEMTQGAPTCEVESLPPPLQPNIDNCGIPNRQPQARIVGGSVTRRSEYPWTAAIAFRENIMAVGALISPLFVITTRNWMQNWYPMYPGSFQVSLGRFNLSTVEEETRSYGVSKVFIRGGKDLAILKLDQDVNSSFKPVCLPRSFDSLRDGVSLTATGWGQTSTDGPLSDILREVILKKDNQQTCVNSYSPGSITSDLFCASAPGKGLCTGDAGSPLTASYQGREYLFGMSSHISGEGCALHPDVFSSIQSQLSWILAVVKDNS